VAPLHPAENSWIFLQWFLLPFLHTAQHFSLPKIPIAWVSIPSHEHQVFQTQESRYFQRTPKITGQQIFFGRNWKQSTLSTQRIHHLPRLANHYTWSETEHRDYNNWSKSLQWFSANYHQARWIILQLMMVRSPRQIARELDISRRYGSQRHHSLGEAGSCPPSENCRMQERSDTAVCMEQVVGIILRLLCEMITDRL